MEKDAPPCDWPQRKKLRELVVAEAEIRQLKDDRFGKSTEKQTSADRSNDLIDPDKPTPPKKKPGQQPGSPGPTRRDYSHQERLSTDSNASNRC